jgi:hypothetical protein
LVNRGNWARRRWLDFRQGHAIYLAFLMTFANFITIQFALLVEREDSPFRSIFTDIWIFAVIFIAAYVPVSIIVGYWHRKSQWKIEQEAAFRENVIGARMWLFMLELIEGKVTEKEKQEVRTMLKQIMKKDPVDKTDRLGSAAEEDSEPTRREGK